MSSTLPWLVAFLAFASLTFLADGAPLQVMSAPNLLRVGTAEKIFVECQDCTGGDIPVEIIVRNHPTKTKRLANTTVTLTGAQNFQALGEINIPVGVFSKDPNIKQYVYLQAQFPGRLLEKIVLVSFQSGYIFIQTDKTLYTPNSNGIHSGVYKLSEIASLGLWKVVAKFHSNPQQIYSAEFEVKEYVLPSFEVKLTSQSPFFYVDSEVFEVDIKAEYLFGEEVNGMAYVVFGVMHEGRKKSFPSSLQRVPIMKGNGVVTLERKHITEKFNIEQQLVGSSIYVAVTVLTENGSEMVEAELRGIQIATSPYTIHFKRTPKYYKPGMSFDVTVEVVNPDDSPADSVDVVVDPGQVQGSTAANGLARLTINTDAGTSRLTVTAKTNVPGITRERQATATMEALPYKTTNNNYIHIGVDAAELKLGDNLKVSFIFGGQQSQTRNFTYLILSKGQLVKRGHGKVSDKLFSKMVLITKEMLPSFRIIAYFHTDDNEVVADSVWVDVKDSCMGSVWDIVEKYDTGCTPGGGNSMSVFYDAGLLFESNTASGTPYRQELKCPAHSRRKRTTIMDVITSLASQYNDPLQRECCKDGMVDLPLSYSCEVRSEYIEDGAACVEAFLHCCKEMENQRAERRQDSLQLARSEEDDKNYMDSNEIVTRTKFPESWLWKDINLPACPKQIPNCRTTSVVEVVRLQDSITTWQFTGISLSRTHGICVGESLEVIVRKDFFIDLRLPYSAVQGEQLEVKAILHNYSPDEITVRVDLTETEHVCSVASKHGRYRQEVKMGGLTTLSVPFIIIPMKDGQYPIKVKAIVKDSGFNDGIEKKLRVWPHGEIGPRPPHVSGLCVLVPTDPHPPSSSGMSQVCLLLALLTLCSCTKVSSTNSLELVKEQWSSYENQCLDYLTATPPATGLVCNRTFDLYVCWPDGLPGTTVNVSCPWFLPWYRKVQQGLVYRVCNEDGQWEEKNTSECEDDPGENQYGRILSQLRIMYTVGYSLSLGALLLALGILITFRKLHCMRNNIHMNLFASFILRAVSILVKDALLTLTLDTRSSSDTQTQGWVNIPAVTWCRGAMVMMQYSVMANNYWLLVEGIYLHSLLVITVFSEKKYFYIYLAIGWGAPLIFVLPWITVKYLYENVE
ncbi:Complement C3 Complement C3 beta chain Complement C3 alpha chain [Larimichthys crocea]|uniref:Complement C3 Complement C3 beta chain Complement C3 alpha chain n=1 Tax=Larimichthys crocea TaxID=215358 RepID=A0A6G0JBI4_LARCR|nr:Complement C3 Complement C3 beta chain Complement C3 alpha chain [Larimichthys crocea]